MRSRGVYKDDGEKASLRKERGDQTKKGLRCQAKESDFLSKTMGNC